MTRGRKLTFAAAAGAAALLVVGLGAAGAIAASRVLSPGEESKTVIDDAAQQLGVQPNELSDALKQALKNRVDEAVDAGVLTKEQARKLKDGIDSGEYPLLFGPGLHGRGLDDDFGGRGFGGHLDILGTAATYLGMSEDEVREALAGKTLADIAKNRGKSSAGLVAVLVTAEEKTIDEAVSDGRMTKAQATEISRDSRPGCRRSSTVSSTALATARVPASGAARASREGHQPPSAARGLRQAFTNGADMSDPVRAVRSKPRATRGPPRRAASVVEPLRTAPGSDAPRQLPRLALRHPRLRIP